MNQQRLTTFYTVTGIFSTIFCQCHGRRCPGFSRCLRKITDAFLEYAFKEMKENWNIHFHVSSKNVRINFLQYHRASKIYFSVFYVMHTAFMCDYLNSSIPGQNWTQFWQTAFSNKFSWMKMVEFRIKCHCIFPRSPIDNTLAMVQVMAWRRTGDKPLPEPMMAQLTNAYMRH